MQLLRWNNPGAGHQTSVFRGERGWMSRNKTCASCGGRKMFLTSPFIDQAITLKTLFKMHGCIGQFFLGENQSSSPRSKNRHTNRHRRSTATDASRTIPATPLTRLSKTNTTTATTAIVLTIPRSICFQIPMDGFVSSAVSDGINGMGCRSVAPQFLQKREPVSVEPHCGQTEV